MDLESKLLKENTLLCKSDNSILGCYLLPKSLINKIKASFFPTLFSPFQLPRSGKPSTSRDVTPSLNSPNNVKKSSNVNILLPY